MRKASGDVGHESHGDLRRMRGRQIPSPVDSGFELGWLRLLRNVAGVAAFASLACSDASGPDAVKPQNLSGVRRLDRSGLVVVRDGAIDQTDTHFAAEADVSVALTISSDTLIMNPMTGTLVYEFTLPPHSDSLQVEAGFDVYGNTHVNSYKLTTPNPDVAPGDELRASLSVNAVHTNVAGTGSPFAFDGGSGVMPPLSTESLGDVSNIPIDQFVGGNGGGGEGGGGGGGAGGGGPLMELRMPLASGVVQSGNERRTVDARGILHVRQQIALQSIKDLAAAGGTGSVTTERTYESAGDYWILSTVAMRVEAVRGRTKVLSLSSLSLTRTRTFYNSRKAAERARRRQTHSSDLVSIETPLNVVTVNPCIARLQYAVDSETAALRSDCGTSGGGPSGFGSTAIPIPACPSPFEHAASGAQNLVLVHGFQANACAWSYVAPQIQGVSGTLAAVSVNTFGSYADQAASVMARVQAYGGSSGKRFVLIGHSMGGEVVRLAAQTSPAIIRGTITVGSPNQGAPLVNNAPYFLSFANAVAFAVWRGSDRRSAKG